MSSSFVNPWNELNPYNEGQSIYGRNQMISQLVDAIYTNLQTVLYGKSGIGKTSLLQAGCFPELRMRQFFPVVIRLGIMERSDDYVASVIDIIREAAANSIPGIKSALKEKKVGDDSFTTNRLCQFLYTTQFIDETNTPFIPILIFDQFEEFLNNKVIFDRAVAFVKELYVLLDNTIPIPQGCLEYSNYRLVFAIREDYLYCLEDIIDRYNLDELRYNRYRITALTDKQARLVIEKTFSKAIETITPQELKSISDTIIPIAKGENAYADIQTPILSLLGSLIFKQITTQHAIDSINPSHEVYLYYDDIMSEPALPLEVRWFLEQKLITVDGRRDSMDFQSALITNEISEEQIDYLVYEKKILRIVDAGSGEQRLEFSHDTLCKALKPVIKMRESFYQNGNNLYYNSFDVEEKQPEMVKFLSYATELGHLDAKQKLDSLYYEQVKGIEEDKKFKASTAKRERISILLNGGEWVIDSPQTNKSSKTNNNRYDIFLSYARADTEVVMKVYKELQTIGCNVFFDYERIESGDAFVQEIIKAIKASDIIMFFASKNAYISQWVSREVAFALDLKKKIIVVKIDDAPMMGSFEFRLSRLDWTDLRDENQKLKLYKYIKRYLDGKDMREERNGVELLNIMVGDIPIKMIQVEGGAFTMGATERQGGINPDERIIHDVSLSPYYISEIPVTLDLWEKVMGKRTSSKFFAKLTGKNDYAELSNHPVNYVSWEECMAFIKCLNAMTGKEFRLPTEAEWEYAARGGIKGRYNGYKYSGSNNLNAVAWYDDNSGRAIHEVAQKQPNEIGLYDMSGNIWEWCSDWYAPYSNTESMNPQGPEDGAKKVCRGGSWNDNADACRITRRESRTPQTKNAYIGFRLAL